MSDAWNARRVYAVSELTAEARFFIEERFPLLWVEGEVSNFNRPASGHWYFSLKDDRAQLRCAMFASRNRFVRARIRDGMRVVMRCRLSLYEGRGEFQAIAEHLEPAGEGALRAAFDQLKAKLEREGLFAAARKRPLPEFPRCVGIVSSASGAALQDVLAVLRRRFPLVDALCFPVAVQGMEAVAQIAAAMDQAEALPRPPDALLLARGGGSLEDLAAFNSEALARRIARCEIPVVSAVGHETDVTIADFAADRRAPTPSAAAELLVPDQAALINRVRAAEQRLGRRARERIAAERRVLEAVRRRVAHPARALAAQREHTLQLGQRLHRAMAERCRGHGARLRATQQRLTRSSPALAIERGRERARHAHGQLARAMRHGLDAAAAAVAGTARAMQAVSPLNTLSRGYAILSRPDGSRWGEVTTDAGALKPGMQVEAHLASGTVAATVDAVRPPPDAGASA